MGVFERGFRSAVPEQSADGEDGLALPQGDAGMGMTKTVKSDVTQLRFGAVCRPETVQPTCTRWPSGPGRREDPPAGPLDPVEDLSCRAGYLLRRGRGRIIVEPARS